MILMHRKVLNTTVVKKKYETRSLGKPKPAQSPTLSLLGVGERSLYVRGSEALHLIHGHYLPALPPALPRFSLLTFA